LFLDDHPGVTLAHDALVVELLVSFREQKPLRIRAHSLVFGQRHTDLLDARAVAAFADELGALGHETEAFADLTEALVHVAKDALVPPDSLPALVHARIILPRPNSVGAGYSKVMETAHDADLEATLARLRAAEGQLQERTKTLREANVALREQRERYAQLFEFAPTGYLVTDRVGRIAEANRAAGELLGLAPHLLIGKDLTGFVPRGARQDFRDRLTEAQATDARSRFEVELEPQGGAPIAVDVSVARMGAGELRWALQDVSDRARAAEDLRHFASSLEERVLERTAELEEERARLAAIVDHIPGGLMILNPSGGVVVANEEVLHILRIPGFQVSDIDGYRVWRGFRPDGSEYAPEEWPAARSLLTGEVVTGERIEFVRGDGSRGVVDVSTAAVRDTHGAIIGAVALLFDVTTREIRERAERDFVTNAAHELQSPLAAVVSAIEVLQAGAKDGPERDRFLEHIENAAARLARLTRALMILARAQTLTEAPAVELVSVCELLERVAGTLQPTRGVEVTVSCPRDVAVITNRELIEQSLISLADNAAKWTQDGVIELTARTIDEGVELAIADTGPGIPADERSRVFDRFYHAESSTATGFGLGLAIVRTAAEALGAEVDLDSTVGAGTVVRLKLPGAATLISP
jgi:PAS domain S-box-containing protein